jgi:hypothetical protein
MGKILDALDAVIYPLKKEMSILYYLYLHQRVKKKNIYYRQYTYSSRSFKCVQNQKKQKKSWTHLDASSYALKRDVCNILFIPTSTCKKNSIL